MELPQELCPGHHRDAPLLTCEEFGVVGVDRRGKDRAVHIVRKVLRLLAVVHLCPFFFQIPGKLALLHIAAADTEALFQKDRCKSAHADAADPDKKDMTRIPEIKTIRFHKTLLTFPWGETDDI